MEMQMRLGDPLLIFIYSMSLLLFGCAIGIFWHATPSVTNGLAIAGAALMVLHDTLTSLIWFGIATVWERWAVMAERNKPADQ